MCVCVCVCVCLCVYICECIYMGNVPKLNISYFPATFQNYSKDSANQLLRKILDYSNFKGVYTPKIWDIPLKLARKSLYRKNCRRLYP